MRKGLMDPFIEAVPPDRRIRPAKANASGFRPPVLSRAISDVINFRRSRDRAREPCRAGGRAGGADPQYNWGRWPPSRSLGIGPARETML